MNTIQLYLSLPWEESPAHIGDLTYERIRGNEVYGIELSTDWLSRHRDIALSGDVQNLSGKQYSSGKIFGFLADALPDRWGRRLIDKRERLLAIAEKREAKALTDFDYLIQLDDATRMGALRLQADGGWLCLDKAQPIPPVTQLREFVDIAHRYEASEAENKPISEQWIDNLFRQGSSLGGARPKANVRDVDGTLYIAKIPSLSDDYDVALWEHFAHELGRVAGVNTAQTQLLTLEGVKYHTLLSRRFDRIGDQRIPFASAMTMCNLQDGADASTGNGYPDIADVMMGGIPMANQMENLKQLYRRIAFNICIGNNDDHFRNHGFLLTKEGWTLSPAYDINPTNRREQSLLITETTNESSLEALLDGASLYMLHEQEARTIIEEVINAVKKWQQVATRCQISKSEQERFAERLSVSYPLRPQCH